ncbi:hypothetical protein SprV_0301202200 [Sparganum proliferum]
MPALPTRIPHMNRSRCTPSDPIRHQPANVYLFSLSRFCRKPSGDRHPRHCRSHCRCPAAIIDRHHPPCSNPFIDCRHQHHHHHDFPHSLHQWDDV